MCRRTALDTLYRLLRNRRILASAVATSKSYPVVCFSERALLDMLAMRCYRPHLGRWDYEPFGVAIEKSTAIELGAKSVIYGQPSDRKRLSMPDRFRFHPVGTTYDWRTEQEWRFPKTVNLDEIPQESLRVFASATDQALGLLSDFRFPITWLVPIEPEDQASD